jgi:GNAT superfamily N-acetyltransferase
MPVEDRDHPKHFEATLVEGSDVSAIAAGSILDWDSRLFGFTAARLDRFTATGLRTAERLQTVLSAFLDKCRERGVRHLIARVGAEELDAIHTLERNDFELLDGVQTFSLRLESRPSDPSDGDFTIRLSQPGDEEQVAAIARTAYVYDRFHADSMLSAEQADRVHEEWMRNSCRGLAADAVFVAASGDRVIGYVTCKIDRDTQAGVIVLVATLKEFRGRGVARQTTQRALQWFWDHDVRMVEVGTQLRNVEAGRVYENAGFRLTNVSLTFRKDLG